MSTHTLQQVVRKLREADALNRIGYRGPLSIEWEDAAISRDWWAQDALAFVRRIDMPARERAFDSAFRSEHGDARARRHETAVDAGAPAELGSASE